jgi:hypothetical protein
VIQEGENWKRKPLPCYCLDYKRKSKVSRIFNGTIKDNWIEKKNKYDF